MTGKSFVRAKMTRNTEAQRRQLAALTALVERQRQELARLHNEIAALRHEIADLESLTRGRRPAGPMSQIPSGPIAVAQLLGLEKDKTGQCW